MHIKIEGNVLVGPLKIRAHYAGREVKAALHREPHDWTPSVEDDGDVKICHDNSSWQEAINDAVDIVAEKIGVPT